MTTRRELLAMAAAAAVTQPAGAAQKLGAPGGANADLTPDAALERLRQGNADFMAGKSLPVDASPRRRVELASGQSPFCAYVSCSDSRAPPELLFGRGLGEVFMIRNAGNTVDAAALGSIEYAVAQLKVPLVVIMGHGKCGAVEAALSVVDSNARFPGQIGKMIEPIIPAVLESRGRPGDRLEAAVRANVSRTVRMLRQESDPLMLRPQAEGRLKVVGAYYELDTGRVDFFDLP